MTMEEIKRDIKERISKVDQSFTNFWSGLYFEGLLDENTDSLERILKKVKRIFVFNNIASIISSTILIIFSLLKYFDIISFGSMDKAGLLILFTIVFLINTYRYYRVKVNLENKIYLLKLLERLDNK